MEFLCTPTIATAAIFTALMFLDVFRREYALLPSHGFFGILSILLVSVLCQNGASAAAWGLLSIPFIVLIIGWFLLTSQPEILQPVIPSAEQCAMCRKRVSKCACRPKA